MFKFLGSQLQFRKHMFSCEFSHVHHDRLRCLHFVRSTIVGEKWGWGRGAHLAACLLCFALHSLALLPRARFINLYSIPSSYQLSCGLLKRLSAVFKLALDGCRLYSRVSFTFTGPKSRSEFSFYRTLCSVSTKAWAYRSGCGSSGCHPRRRPAEPRRAVLAVRCRVTASDSAEAIKHVRPVRSARFVP